MSPRSPQHSRMPSRGMAITNLPSIPDTTPNHSLSNRSTTISAAESWEKPRVAPSPPSRPTSTFQNSSPPYVSRPPSRTFSRPISRPTSGIHSSPGGFPAISRPISTPSRPHSTFQPSDSHTVFDPASAAYGFPPAPSGKEPYLVQFSPDDPWNPQNFTSLRKLKISAVATYCCFCSTFASSAFSPNLYPLSYQFGVSTEVTTLATSLFILGYAFGPMIWGPLSEMLGRRLPITVSMLGFVCFSAGVATGKDLQTVLICRFFGGVMGSGPLSVVAGMFGDIYDQLHRGVAIAVFATSLFVGPVLAPFIGGFTVMNDSLGWRFNGYWILILSGLAFALCVFFLEETFAPVVLSHKASKLRRETGNWALYAKQDEVELDFNEMFTKYFSRPMVMLVQEPVLLLVSFYMSFIYGILYLSFTSYPIVFQRVHHFNPGVGGLPFFSLAIGVFGSCLTTILLQKPYHKKLIANNFRSVPEWRLPQVMVGGISFTIGLFWFGWTGDRESIHWIVPTMSGIFTGFGIISIFMQLFNYLVDTYLMYSASVISANTIMRSAFAAGIPMFATYMYEGLGIGLATTVIGCVAAALIPVPVLFYFFGPRLRQASKYAPTGPPMPPAGAAKKGGDEEKNALEEQEKEREKDKELNKRWSAASKRLSNRVSWASHRRSLQQLDVNDSDSLDTLLRQRYHEILSE